METYQTKEAMVEIMELTQAQQDYINCLVEDWNKVVSNKSPKDFVKDEFDMAVVTSTAAMVAEHLRNQSHDPEVAGIWGLIILGAFLYSEGLMHLKENELQ